MGATDACYGESFEKKRDENQIKLACLGEPMNGCGGSAGW
jgi:hypothetical protein